MPKKKHVISDRERAKRLQEAARELETSNDPKDFERAFKKVAPKRAPTSRSNGA
jgi:hypothetical protein